MDWDIRKGKTDDMLVNRRAAGEMGVQFVMPHINRSKETFTVDGKEVVWSLLSVAKVGAKAAKEIARKQPYKTFDDFLTRINKAIVKFNVIENLIWCGAFDHFGDRRDLMDQFWKKCGGTKKKPEVDDAYIVQRFYDSMGFFEKKIKDLKDFDSLCITERELRDYEPGEEVAVGGMVAKVRSMKTKKGDNMGFVTLVDLDELIDVTVFPRAWSKFRELLKEGAFLQIHGTKSDYGGKQNAIQADYFLKK